MAYWAIIHDLGPPLELQACRKIMIPLIILAPISKHRRGRNRSAGTGD
jgi:hypothetical protein